MSTSDTVEIPITTLQNYCARLRTIDILLQGRQPLPDLTRAHAHRAARDLLALINTHIANHAPDYKLNTHTFPPATLPGDSP